MKVLFEGTDISDSVNMIKCIYADCASGSADTLDIIFADGQNLWRKWQPKKNQKIQVIKDGVDSGTMFVSDISFVAGEYSLKGRSTPQTALNTKSQVWEDVSFETILSDVAGTIGLGNCAYDIENIMYRRIGFSNEKPIYFLKQLCIYEGFALKAFNGSLIVYDEKKIEAKGASTTISESDFVRFPHFPTADVKLIKRLEISSFKSFEYLRYSFDVPVDGKEIKEIRSVNDLGEAERYVKGKMRYHNKNELTGIGIVEHKNSLCAGSSFFLEGNYGANQGKNFIYRSEFDMANDRVKIHFRKPLEGY